MIALTIQTTAGSHRRLMASCRLAALALAAVVCLLALPSPARADRFPNAGDFNGLSITYSISGAQLGIPVDTESFTTTRRIDGTMTGGRLEVSGSVGATGGWSAAVSVTVSAGGESDSFTAGSPPAPNGLSEAPWSQDFTVGVDVPPGASGSVTIFLSGEYNAGGRALEVVGSFQGDGSVTGGTNDGGTTGGDDGASGGTTGGGQDDGTTPWRTAAGGLAAVLAAAAAIAGAAVKGAKAEGRELDPNKPVGYILHLSRQEVRLSTRESAPMEATVYKVLPDGGILAAEGATITVQPPPGVAAEPLTGTTTLQTLAWQTGAVQPGAQMVFAAAAAGGGASAAVSVSAEEAEGKLVLEFEPPDKRVLVANGKDSVTLVGKVVLGGDGAAAAEPAALEAQQSIEFSGDGQWLDLSAAVDWGTDAKAVRIQGSQPDPDHPVQPPESVPVTCRAQVGVQTLETTASVSLARLPSIDADPDHVEFSAQSGETAEVKVWIENGDDAAWTFSLAWREESAAPARATFDQTAPTTGTVTLTEASGEGGDASRPEITATLRVLATADGYDDLERYIKVTVWQEGLFIESTGRHNDGTFHILADGQSSPTDIDVRAYVRDAEGRVVLDEQAGYDVEWRPTGAEGTPGAAALAHGDLQHESVGIRELNVNSAIHRFVYPRLLPTDGTPIAATLEAQVPGRDNPAFTKLVSISLVGPATAPYTNEWLDERQNCLDIIYSFVPGEAKVKFVNLVLERGKTMGAEGLFEMRKRMWAFARNSLLAESEDYLYTAEKWQMAEDLASWVSWCVDIAMGVATGTLVGTSAAFAIGIIKPSLVNAMEVWTKGGDINDWARGQLGVGIATGESVATDIDLLRRVPGGAPVAWTIFICYWFIRELMRDPDMSVKNAMIAVVRMVRDQALITFLRGVYGTKPGQPVVVDGGTAPVAPKPLPQRPAGWRPPDDVPAVKVRPPKPGQPPVKPITKPGTVKPGAAEPGTAKPDAPEPPSRPPIKPGDAEPPARPPVKPGDAEPPTKPKAPGDEKPATPPEKAPATPDGVPAHKVPKTMAPEPGESHADAVGKIAAAQKGHPKEVGTITKNGKVIHTVEGTAAEVDFPPELLEGSDTIHSHCTQRGDQTLTLKDGSVMVIPDITRPGGPPSAADIGHAIEYKQNSTAVIGENGAGQQTKFTVRVKEKAIGLSDPERTQLSGEIMSEHKAIVKELNGTIDQQIRDAANMGGSPEFIRQLVQKRANMQARVGQEALTRLAKNPKFSDFIDVSQDPVAP